MRYCYCALAADISEVQASCTLSGLNAAIVSPLLASLSFFPLRSVFLLPTGRVFSFPGRLSLLRGQVYFPLTVLYHPVSAPLAVQFFRPHSSIFSSLEVALLVFSSPTTVCASESSVAQFSIPYFDQSPLLLWPTPVLRPQEAAVKNNSDESEPSPSPVCKCLAPALLFLCPDQSPSHFVVLQRCLSAFTLRRAPSSHSNNGKSRFLHFLLFLFFFFCSSVCFVHPPNACIPNAALASHRLPRS